MKLDLIERVGEGKYDVEGKLRVRRSIGKPNCLLYQMIWIAHGTGTILTEKVIGEKK